MCHFSLGSQLIQRQISPAVYLVPEPNNKCCTHIQAYQRSICFSFFSSISVCTVLIYSKWFLCGGSLTRSVWCTLSHICHISNDTPWLSAVSSTDLSRVNALFVCVSASPAEEVPVCGQSGSWWGEGGTGGPGAGGWTEERNRPLLWKDRFRPRYRNWVLAVTRLPPQCKIEFGLDTFPLFPTSLGIKEWRSKCVCMLLNRDTTNQSNDSDDVCGNKACHNLKQNTH